MSRLRTHNNRRKTRAEKAAEWHRWASACTPFTTELAEKLLALLEGVEPLGEHEDIGEYLVDEFDLIFNARRAGEAAGPDLGPMSREERRAHLFPKTDD